MSNPGSMVCLSHWPASKHPARRRREQLAYWCPRRSSADTTKLAGRVLDRPREKCGCFAFPDLIPALSRSHFRNLCEPSAPREVEWRLQTGRKRRVKQFSWVIELNSETALNAKWK